MDQKAGIKKLKISPRKITIKRPGMGLAAAKATLGFKPKTDISVLDLVGPVCDLRAEKGLINAINHNERITDMLDQLIDVTKKVRANCTDSREKTRHSHRINSFNKALDAIRAHERPISNQTEAMKLKGVGKGIGSRIQELLETGELSELTKLRSEIKTRTRTIAELCQITGIGEVRAATLHDKHGVTGITDLLSKYRSGKIRVTKNQLTHHIAVGLEYYQDLKHRIPWAEVDQIRRRLEPTISNLDPKLVVTVCGSYRRHKETCGDIDVLIAHPSLVTDSDLKGHKYLTNLVSVLTETGLLVGHLTEHGETKYMGVCKLNPDSPGRRIDIRFVTMQAYPAALLYFTGSGQLNKLMRYKANEMGYTINEYGIYKYSNGVKGKIIPVSTEQDIFKVINCKYLEPTERDF